MLSYFKALLDPSMAFIRNALMAGILSSILFGLLGSVVTVKRIAGLAGAISHAVLGGIGMALFLSASGLIPGFPPMLGALVFAIISALIIAFVSLKAKQREDTVINALWAIGMSMGVLFLAKTPGYADPMTYLFGNILLVTEKDLILLGILDAVILFLSWRYYPQLVASAFDEEFAKTRGIATDAIFIVILVLSALAVVLLQTFVGIVMVIAMLTLPAGTAGFWAKSLASMMLGATILSLLFTLTGLMGSWVLDLPAGATVVVIAGAVFLLFSAFSAVKKQQKKHRI